MRCMDCSRVSHRFHYENGLYDTFTIVCIWISGHDEPQRMRRKDLGVRRSKAGVESVSKPLSIENALDVTSIPPRKPRFPFPGYRLDFEGGATDSRASSSGTDNKADRDTEHPKLSHCSALRWSGYVIVADNGGNTANRRWGSAGQLSGDVNSKKQRLEQSGSGPGPREWCAARRLPYSANDISSRASRIGVSSLSSTMLVSSLAASHLYRVSILQSFPGLTS